MSGAADSSGQNLIADTWHDDIWKSSDGGGDWIAAGGTAFNGTSRLLMGALRRR